MLDDQAPPTRDNNAKTGELEFALPLPSARRGRRSTLGKAEATTPVQPPKTEPTPGIKTDPGLIPVPVVPDRKIEEEAPPLPLPGVEDKLTASSQARSNHVSAVPASTAPSPHGTPAATLYYTDRRQAAPPRENIAVPAKPAPEASSASAIQPETRPTALKSISTIAPSPAPVLSSSASSVRDLPPNRTSVPDYRANIERQSKEQKSMSHLLSFVVYGLLALFILGAGLSGYGAYILSEQIRGQAVTIDSLRSTFDRRLDEVNRKNDVLAHQLNDTIAALSKTSEQSLRQQAALNQLQDQLNFSRKIASDNTAAAVTRERNLREEEIAGLKLRLQRMEAR